MFRKPLNSKERLKIFMTNSADGSLKNLAAYGAEINKTIERIKPRNI